MYLTLTFLLCTSFTLASGLFHLTCITNCHASRAFPLVARHSVYGASPHLHTVKHLIWQKFIFISGSWNFPFPPPAFVSPPPRPTGLLVCIILQLHTVKQIFGRNSCHMKAHFWLREQPNKS